MLVLGTRAPDAYRMLLQEDRSVEWGTVWLFLTAGVLGLYRSVRDRRVFDGLVALFCFFVAGEEFSWGQRLFGYYPPEFFLANNFQQEINVHNLPQWFLQPKWILIAVLAGFGVLLPILARARRPRALMTHVGATPPPVELLPWFIALIVLLVAYPLTLTGEWVELLAGGLFVMSLRPLAATAWTALALTFVFGLAMPQAGDALERGRDAGRTECATAEVRALLNDVTTGTAATGKLQRMRRLHTRVWPATTEGYLRSEALLAYRAVLCAGSGPEVTGLRHTYGLDPWGSPYWLLVEKNSKDSRRAMIYSFGPNRRRDIEDTTVDQPDTGDDVIVTTDWP